MSDYFCDFCGVRLIDGIPHHCAKDALDELAVEIKVMRETIEECTSAINNMINSISPEIWEQVWEIDDDELEK